MHHYLVLFGPSTGYSHYLVPTCLRDGEQLIQNILPISWALLVLTLAVMPWQDVGRDESCWVKISCVSRRVAPDWLVLRMYLKYDPNLH